MPDAKRTEAARPTILIDAVPDLPPMPASDVRAQAIADPGLEYAVAVTRDVAGQVYVDRHAAMDEILQRYAQTGNAPDTLSELERDPSAFGALKGATRLGLANAERRNALEKVPQLASKAGEALHQVKEAESRIAETDNARRAARAKPLPDLSEGAQQFLARVKTVSDLPSGAAKNKHMAELMKDGQSIKEVTRFRQALSARYGKGRSAVEEGLSKDGALKAKSAPQREAAATRVQTVMTQFPAMVQMQTQVRQQERNRDLGKDQSRGIER